MKIMGLRPSVYWISWLSPYAFAMRVVAIFRHFLLWLEADRNVEVLRSGSDVDGLVCWSVDV